MDEVELWRLRNSEAVFLRAMATGTTLGATVELMMSQGYTFDLETLLVKYVQSGCLVAANIDQR